jgi:hypothetical protein
MAVSTYCNAYPESAGERASDIIVKVGAACNISQKVLLVLFEKEQSLVSHARPSQSRFDRVTGFSCPDSAPSTLRFRSITLTGGLCRRTSLDIPRRKTCSTP